MCIVNNCEVPVYNAWQYSKTGVKRPLKNRQNKGLNDNW